MNRYIILIFIGLITPVYLLGQEEPLNPSVYIDSIAAESDQTINGITESERMSASYRLIGQLKHFIRVPGSYATELYEIPGILQIRQEDNEFRIITWQVEKDDLAYRHFGVIQFNSDTGRFIPLIDYSDLYKRPDIAIVTPDKWFGMAYYGIKTVKSGKKTYYTLFGYDAYNEFSTRKYIDIMWWDKDTLKFGAPLFTLPDMAVSPNRFILEYNKNAATSLNYNPDENLIMYDHLTLLGGAEDKANNYVPDGTYEGFAWKKGKWVHEDMIDYQKLEDGQAPMPDPKKVSDDLTPNK